jgi:hypothetical protein
MQSCICCSCCSKAGPGLGHVVDAPAPRSKVLHLLPDLQRQEQLIAVLRRPAVWAVAVEVRLKAVNKDTDTVACSQS